MLKLWNTCTKSLEDFHPLHDNRVGFYACGPTVYNPATIGNLRSYVAEDILRRTLELLGYTVEHVMNITDVGHLVGDRDEGEDKMEREAAKRGTTAWEIAKEYEERFLRDIARLDIETPNKLPHATNHIKEQIALVKTLEEKGFTYEIFNGIYFDTSKFKPYGAFSGQKLEEKEEGMRVAANPEKKHPSDFALWKFSPKEGKRQMEWESPWGVGFPGWHLECSAMSVKYLGQPFDIHAGGVDHIPVHHENEIAQSEAAYGKELAEYWMHVEFLLVDGRRMGKSEGNAYTLDDLIAKNFDPLAFRLYCLGTHYRSKMNFTWEGLEAAQHALKKLRQAARELEAPAIGCAEFEKTFAAALEDDLNVPKALAVVWELLGSDQPKSAKAEALLRMDRVLGLGLKEYIGQAIPVPDEITALAEEREQARKTKDWKRSDELRDQINAKGWSIEDGDEGYSLHVIEERHKFRGEES